jgi:hypothetical protein
MKMSSRKILFVSALVFILIAMQFVSAATNISSCQTISSPGIYTLNQSIVGASACMIIASSNVTFDCQGNTMIYGAAGAADGIGINVFYLAVPLTNITIKNCIIQDNNTLRANGHGIQFTRVSDSYIFNNTIQTNGTSTNYGISFTTSCNRNIIENNTINTLGSSTGNYGLSFTTAASDNLIIRNNITGVGTTTSSAIYFTTDADNNTVKNNNLTTISTIASGNNADPQTVNIVSGDLNNITGNYIYAQGAQRCYGVYILTDAEGNIVENNNITANSNSGATTYGVYILRAPFTVVQGNNIGANGTGTLRGVVTTNAPSTIIQNNNINISVLTASTLDGVLSSSASPYTTIKNNIIALTGVGTINGVSITTAHYSYIQNNTIIINGTGTTDNGVFSTSSEYIFIQNNSISINGTTT